MTIHAYKNAALSALAVSAVLWSGTAQAATDYLIKFEGVPVETAGKDDRRHRNWIIIESVQLAPGAAAEGGVHVASGDVNGDGVTGANTSARRTYQPANVCKNIDKSKPVPPADKKITAPDDETTALLLPAMQKARVAAARMSAWAGCAAGQKIEAIAIKQKTTGREGRILDATVSSCSGDTISFNFTKIEW